MKTTTANQARAYFAGPHFLPELSDKEIHAFNEGEYHKVRKSAHVQAMEALLNNALSVPPTEVNGAVLAYDGLDTRGGKEAYVLVTEVNDEDGENQLFYTSVAYLDRSVNRDVLARLRGKTKDELLKERFEHPPPRAISL